MLENLNILGRNLNNYKQLNSPEKTLSSGGIKYHNQH